MATKKPKTTKPEDTEDQKLLALIRKRASKGINADRHNRSHVTEAKQFLNLKQWHPADEINRKNRPMLVIDRINPAIDQAIGDQRQNLPGLKVRPCAEGATVEWARIKEGKIRHILNQINAKMSIDKASEHQLQGGMGFIRLITDYASDKTNDQKIELVPIYNELSVIRDPAAVEWDFMDGNWFMIYYKMSKDSYKEEYGEEPTSLEVEGDNSFIWRDDDMVIIAEYFYKEFSQKILYELNDGTNTEKKDYNKEYYNLDKDGKPKQREAKSYKIYRIKIDGANILEEKKEWPSKFWPVVPVWGKEINVEGKTYYRGITKNAMDAQRMYNYYASAGAESFALSTKSKLFVTPEMIVGHEDQWNNLNNRNDPYTLVNAINPSDPKSIMWPQRIDPPQASSAIVQGLVQAADDIRTTTGRQLDSLGAPSNAESGVAIGKRQMEGDVGDYAYADNLNRAYCRVGEIILDLMPTIYDTKRDLRVLGEDGVSTKELTINEPVSPADNKPMSVRGFANDMTVGRYEVIVDAGPSFTTQRQEAAAFYTSLVQGNPAMAGVVGDIMMRNMDIPQSQVVSDRIRAEMVKGGKAYLLNPEELQDLVKKLPLIGQPTPPPPLLVAKIQAEMAKAELNKAKAQTEMANLGMIKIETAQAAFESIEKLAMLYAQMGQPQQQIPGQGQPGQQPGGPPVNPTP